MLLYILLFIGILVMAKVTLNTIGSRYGSIDALNDNFEALEEALENTLSRDGTTPNEMGADLDMNSHDIINVGEISVDSLRLGGLPVTPGTLTYNGVVKQTIIAEAGQTVFDLTSITYSPYTNNLSVYIDGVYQNPSRYTETDNNTVTLSEGVHEGAVVDFQVMSLNDLGGTADSANVTHTPAPTSLLGTTPRTVKSALDDVTHEETGATKVGYIAAGTGAEGRTVANKLNEIVSVKDFGAVGDGVTDDTAAIQAALASGAAAVYVPSGNYVVTQSLAIPSNVTLQGQGAGSTISLNNCSITPALIVGSTYTAATQPSAYYTREPSTNTGNFVATVTVSAPVGSTQLTLSSTAGLSAGDYLFLSNGYCDMYRVMEQYTGPYTDWQQTDVKLWQAEFVQIASVVGNIVTLEIPTTIGITVPTTTYGFFPNENNLPQYAGFNTPSVEKLCGAVNASVRDLQINANIGVSQAAILSYLSQNFVVENVKITSTGRGIQNFSALNPVIKSCFIDSQSLAISVRRASFNAIVDVCDTIYSGTEDGSILVWERTNNSTISNINVTSKNGTSSAAAIGVYLNTCSNNAVTNVTGKWLKTVVSIGFGGDGCVVSNVVGQSTDTLVTAFSSRDFVVSGGVMTGKYTASPTAFTGVLFSCSQSYNATYSDLRHNVSYTATPYGRIHLFQAFNVRLSNIVSPLAQLWLSTEDAKTLYPTLPRVLVDNCEFSSGTLSSTTYNDTTQRISYFSNTKFIGQVYVESTLYTSFDNCLFTGSNGLSLHNSAYTSVQNSSFDCNYAVEFKALVSSNNIVSSFIRFTNNQITSTTAKFNNYVNVNGYFVPPGGPPELTSRKTEIVTLLDQYPLIKEWANTGAAGSSASSWKQYFKSPDYT